VKSDESSSSGITWDHLLGQARRLPVAIPDPARIDTARQPEASALARNDPLFLFGSETGASPHDRHYSSLTP
jgi:hypothetical protein